MQAWPQVILLPLLLTACRGAGTVVVVTSAGIDGRPVPVAAMQLVMLPYDRDSVADALAAHARPRPDTMAVAALFDSLRTAYRGTLTGAKSARVKAQAQFERRQEELAPRLDSLRQLQQRWRTEVYGGYDTLTLGLVHRLLRDPFTDTTDAQGIATVQPKSAGSWWVTVSTWDATDPYSDWYWNLPLTGDTLRLTPANAHRRTRF